MINPAMVLDFASKVGGKLSKLSKAGTSPDLIGKGLMQALQDMQADPGAAALAIATDGLEIAFPGVAGFIAIGSFMLQHPMLNQRDVDNPYSKDYMPHE
jgi:hypothetical protein